MHSSGYLFAAGLLTCCLANAQSTVMGHFNPLSADTPGVHLYGASVSGSFFSGGYGVGLPGLRSFLPNSNVGMMQASAVFGWSMAGQKGNMSAVYSPSFARTINGSSYQSLNHSLSLSAGRTLTPKWDLSFSASAVVSDFSQLIFARSQTANLTSIPSTFDDFFGAVMTGRSGNPALTQAVLAAPLQNSPETAYLYGDRLLTTSASVSTSYALSSRSTFNLGISGARSQQFRPGSSLPEETTESVIPGTTGAGVYAGWSYSLTPRTTVGVNASTNRALSRLQDAYSSNVGVSVGRTMSPHWFVNGSVGVGFITANRTTFAPTQKPQMQFGGGMGYKVYAHTIFGSFSRSVSDAYGLGANTSDASTGAWSWKRPGSSLSVSASAGYMKLNGPLFPSAGSWMANVGAGRALNAHLALSVGASFTQFPRSLLGAIPGGAPNMTQRGVVVSLSWSPSARR